jgi:hypothetical protein
MSGSICSDLTVAMPADVLGEEGLVARAEQELPVELVAEDRRDEQADEAISPSSAMAISESCQL